MNPVQAGLLLAAARIDNFRIGELPGETRPRTAEEGYACQSQVVQRMLAHYGGETAGHKIACTNLVAQRLLHTDGPFSGVLVSALCYQSPACLRTDDFFMRVVEAEFAFLMAHDLPPRPQPYAREEVADAVAGVLPGIEIVDSRFTSWTTMDAPSLIADNACHGAWVRGRLLADWRGIDLAAQEVQLIVNGSVRERGSGAAVLGHPLNALQWLANSLSARGIPLQAGEYVTTGVTTDIYMAERGDHIAADFGLAGRVELVFE